MSHARGARVAALLALVLGLLLGSATAASADTDVNVAGIEPTEDGLALSVDVPVDVQPALDQVGATIGDADYAATAERFEAGDTRIRRTTILAIDTSNSMDRDQRFTAAKAAAITFLETVPPDVRVGIITFDSDVEVVLDPVTDRDLAIDTVNALALDRGTRLYDGVLQSIEQAGTTGQRSVLVISDGADTSDIPLDDVVASVEESDVSVDVVALGQEGDDLAALTAIAGGPDGVVSAESGGLNGYFEAQAQLLNRQVLVTVDVPQDLLATAFTVEVTLGSDAGNLIGSAAYAPGAGVGPPEAPTALPVAPDESLPSWVMYLAVALVLAGLLVGLVTLVPAGGPRVPRTPQARISRYTAGLAPGAAPAAQDEPALAQATEAIEGVLRRNRGLEETISSRLLAAGSALKASEWVLLHAAVAVGALVVGLLLGRGSPVLALLFLVGGLLGPWLYLGLRQGSRRRRFEMALPETLQLMSGSLSAGLSMMQALDTIVREGSEPVASEFRRVLVEIRLGVALDDALEGVADRFDSRDFRWVVMAIRIQRQVGGNLAELLTTVSTTIREREYIRRQVSALAAEGKLSAIVLGALPPGFLLYLVVAQPSYVEPLFTDLRGLIMLVGSAIWLGIGIVWMSRLIRVEV